MEVSRGLTLKEKEREGKEEGRKKREPVAFQGIPIKSSLGVPERNVFLLSCDPGLFRL